MALTPVLIEVQRKGAAYIGLVRTYPKGTLLYTCGHVDGHESPGKAVQCAERAARRDGREIIEQ